MALHTVKDDEYQFSDAKRRRPSFSGHEGHIDLAKHIDKNDDRLSIFSVRANWLTVAVITIN
jgi:hypothetical protein